MNTQLWNIQKATSLTVIVTPPNFFTIQVSFKSTCRWNYFPNNWRHSITHGTYGFGLLWLLLENKGVLLLLSLLRNELAPHLAISPPWAPRGSGLTCSPTDRHLGYGVCQADCNNFSNPSAHTPFQCDLDAPSVERWSLYPFKFGLASGFTLTRRRWWK